MPCGFSNFFIFFLIILSEQPFSILLCVMGCLSAYFIDEGNECCRHYCFLSYIFSFFWSLFRWPRFLNCMKATLQLKKVPYSRYKQRFTKLYHLCHHFKMCMSPLKIKENCLQKVHKISVHKNIWKMCMAMQIKIFADLTFFKQIYKLMQEQPEKDFMVEKWEIRPNCPSLFMIQFLLYMLLKKRYRDFMKIKAGRPKREGYQQQTPLGLHHIVNKRSPEKGSACLSF